MNIFKNFLMKQMLKKQMKDIPEAEQEKILNIIDSNPDFFTDIAKSVEEKMKGGMSQTDAIMAVAKMNQDKLKEVMGKK